MVATLDDQGAPTAVGVESRPEGRAFHRTTISSMRWAGPAILVRRLLEIGCQSTDTDQERLAKEVFVVIGLGAGVAGLAWAVMYAALGRPLAGLIPLVVSVTVSAGFVRFVITKRLGMLALPVLGLMVILPLSLQLSLGGFVYGSAVVVWAFAAPLGSLL